MDKTLYKLLLQYKNENNNSYKTIVNGKQTAHKHKLKFSNWSANC